MKDLLWLTISAVSVQVWPDLLLWTWGKAENHDRRVWQGKTILMAARKERVGSQGQNTPFQGMPQVAYFLQLGLYLLKFHLPPNFNAHQINPSMD